MAFDTRNVILGRGSNNNIASPQGLITHTYFSVDDIQTTISAPGHIPDYLGFDATSVIDNDLLLVRDAFNTYRTYRIESASPMSVLLTTTDTPTNPFDQDLNTTDNVAFSETSLTGNGLLLPTTGETPSYLNFYKEFTDPSFLFAASPWASSMAVTISAVRENKKITVRLNNAAAPATVSDFIKSTSALPTWLRPSEDSWGVLQIVNNGAIAIGKSKITTGGIIEIYSDISDGNFDTPSTAGWSTSTITYFLTDGLP